MVRRKSGRRRAAAVAASLVAGLVFTVTATPVLGDSFGESQTQVYVLGDQIAYGDEIEMYARVTDVSDSCLGLVGCDTPSGRIDFYAVSGSSQRFLTSANLTVGYPQTLAYWIKETEVVSACCVPVGSYDSIRGYYVPGNFDPSSADTGPVTVTKSGSTITLDSTSTSIDVGASIDFDVHLAGYSNDPNAIQPAGTVDVYEGATNYGTAFVDADGDATITTTQLPLGVHYLRARWGGDDRWTASTSAPLQVTVGGGTTGTTISASTTTATYGTSITFTGTVTAVDPPVGTPTGSVGFHEGISFLGSGALDEASPDVATWTTSDLAVGSHSIFATYTGDGVYDASQSDTVSVIISKASTTTTLGSSANPSTFGQAVTFTATVDGPGTTTVPGTVQFRDGGTNLGAPQPLVTGQASLTITSLGGGSHSITAVYSGSANYLGSASAILVQSVTCDVIVTGSVGSITTAPGKSTCLNGARVNGGITVAAGSSLSIVSSSVSGTVTVYGATGTQSSLATLAETGAVTICGSTIGGSLAVTGVGGFVLVGDTVDDACAGNTIRGSVAIVGTTGGLAVADNRIGGGVTIAANSGSGPAGHASPEVKANRIGGFVYAYGNTPAVTDDGRPNSVRGWIRLG